MTNLQRISAYSDLWNRIMSYQSGLSWTDLGAVIHSVAEEIVEMDFKELTAEEREELEDEMDECVLCEELEGREADGLRPGCPGCLIHDGHQDGCSWEDACNICGEPIEEDAPPN